MGEKVRSCRLCDQGFAKNARATKCIQCNSNFHPKCATGLPKLVTGGFGNCCGLPPKHRRSLRSSALNNIGFDTSYSLPFPATYVWSITFDIIIATNVSAGFSTLRYSQSAIQTGHWFLFLRYWKSNTSRLQLFNLVSWSHVLKYIELFSYKNYVNFFTTHL